MATTLGFKTGPILTALTEEQRDISLVPATTGEGFGAAAAESFQGSFGPLAWRFAERQITDSPTLTPEEANQKFAIGDLKFSSPVSEFAARQMYESKRDTLRREDIVRRSELGLAGRLGAGLVGAALDPLNYAAAVFPELLLTRFAAVPASATGALGALRTGATAAQAAREGGIGARALYGAAEGAAGSALVAPGTYALSRAEGRDYTVADAFLDTVFGAALGAGLHAGLGAFQERIKTGKPMAPIEEAMQAAGPEVRQDILRGAVSDLLEDRPVGVAPAVDAVIQKYADTELDRILSKVGDLTDAEKSAAAALERVRGRYSGEAIPDRIQAIEADLKRTRADESAATLRAQDAQERAESLKAAGVDDASADRLAQVEYELNWPQGISSARRRELEAERALLTEGAGQTADEAALDALRSETEARGLRRLATRQERTLAGAQSKRETAASAIEKAQQIYEAETGKIASRKATVQAITERTLRRYAGRLGIGVAPEEIQAAARRIVSTPQELAQQRAQFELQRIADMAGIRTPDPVRTAMAQIAQEKAQPYYAPDDLAVSQEVAAIAAAYPAPKARGADQGIGAVTRDTQELDAIEAELDEKIRGLKSQEAMTEAEELSLDEAQIMGEKSQAQGKARGFAAVCLAGLTT